MIATSSSTDAYRRQARCLRSIHAGSPGRMHASLAALARRQDQAAGRPVAVAGASPEVGRFAGAVASALDGPILRYSNRRALIRHAERLGIRRFDANLIIAAVQHRLSSKESLAQRSSGQQFTPPRRTIVPPRHRLSHLLVPLTTLAVIQGSIAASAYLLIHGV